MPLVGTWPKADWTARSALRMFGLAGGTGRQVSSTSASLGLVPSRHRIASQTAKLFKMLKKSVQQGRSERRGEAYSVSYVEPLREARTPLAGFFSILLVEPHMGPQLVIVE